MSGSRAVPPRAREEKWTDRPSHEWRGTRGSLLLVAPGAAGCCARTRSGRRAGRVERGRVHDSTPRFSGIGRARPRGIETRPCNQQVFTVRVHDPYSERARRARDNRVRVRARVRARSGPGRRPAHRSVHGRSRNPPMNVHGNAGVNTSRGHVGVSLRRASHSLRSFPAHPTDRLVARETSRTDFLSS